MPLPLRTDRLLIRMMTTADAPRFAEYRDDPEVARYQLWHLTFTVEDGRVARIYAVRNPHKLAGLDQPTALTRS